MPRIIDLTMPYNEKIAGYERSISHTVAQEGWNGSTLNIYSHAGTHMDSPFHFGVSNQTIDELPIHELVGKAWVADLTHIGASGLISIDDLGGTADQVQKGDSLLLYTDWSNFVGTKKYRDELPRISEELANWCVEIGVNMLGVEPPSVADVNNLIEVTNIHHILLKGGITIIEGLTNLDQIREEQVELIALPLKIENGDGAPARVIAIER